MVLNQVNMVQLPVETRPGDPAPVFTITPIVQSGLNTATPAGLTLSADGVLTWTPTVQGVYGLSVRATVTIAGVSSYTTIDIPIFASRYYWAVGDFGPCSATCGGGTRTRTVTCVNGAESDCVTWAEEKPEISEACNLEPCVIGVWTTGPWGACSAVCGDGTQSRTVTCVDSATGAVLADSVCNAADRPAGNQGCTTPDVTPPTVTCPQVPAIECVNPAGAVAAFNATANDVCDPDVALSCPSSGTTFPLGVSQTLCSAVDDSGNVASCNTLVTVVDTTAPTIACAAPATLECTGDRRAAFDPVDATATDACTAVTVSSYDTLAFPVGVSTLVYSATDTSSNQAACTTTVTVEDTLAPTIACPAAQTVECTGNGRASVDAGDATATDVCGAVTVSDPGELSLLVGDNVVPYTATDEAGHTVACTTTVTVADTTAPSITCPAATIFECTSPAGAQATPALAQASDVCGPASVSAPAAGLYPIGTTAVTYTATDAAGLTASCSSTITVQDSTPPAFDPSTLGPQDLGGSCGAGGASFVTPTATDGCGLATVTCAAGNLLPGANQVTCTATDAAGNQASATVTVNVTPGLRVVFDAPLEDDNVANDVHTDADIANRFKTGSTLPHKVRILDCGGRDVTSLVPVTVRLHVSPGADGSNVNLINDVGDIAGIGDAGGLMVLVDGVYRFNLKTNPAEYPAGGRVFQSLVTVAYTSAPLQTVAAEDARLVTK